MKNETNIEALKSALLALGFPQGLERGLRAYRCLAPAQFTLQYRQRRGADVLSVALHFERTGEGGAYRCPYYEAGLRRLPEIPAVVAGGVDTGALEGRMKAVDWAGVLPSALSDEPLPAGETWEKEEALESIMEDLRRLEQVPEGAPLATLLKRKYWTDTALEAFAWAGGGPKSSQEITQRFYFFEGEAGISLEEAYRFLCLRWRERQWNAERKGLAGPATVAREEGGNGQEQGKKKPRDARGNG